MNPAEEHPQERLISQAELVGSLTHDLKGLLSGVEGGIYLVSSGVRKNKPERLEQGLEMMQRNLARLRRAIGNSLYYVKDREFDRQPLEADEVIRAAVEALAPRARQLGVELRAGEASGRCHADPLALPAALSNLLEYALEACEVAKQRPDPRVTMGARRVGEHLAFELLVEGFAMPDETQAFALDPYYATRGADRSHLGVHMARRLLRLHHGHLEIEADEGAGTTRLRASLPIATPRQEDGPPDVAQSLAEEWDS